MMTLLPETEAFLHALAAAGMRPFEEGTIPEARASLRGFPALQGEMTDLHSVEDRVVEGPLGAIPIRVYRPVTGGNLPAIVYFHGGGFVMGDLEVSDIPCRSLADISGAVVVAVDYRLAPEHRYPAGFEDCYAATTWVFRNAAELGIDAARILVAGDSAGGNFASGVCIAARDRGGPRIAGQMLIYPNLEFDFHTDGYERYGEGYILTRGAGQWFWAHYLGAQAFPEEPHALPGVARDLSDLPATYVAVAEYDPLSAEGRRYAARLAEAGVPVTLSEFAGLVHGFFWSMGALPSSRRVLDEMAAHVAASGAASRPQPATA